MKAKSWFTQEIWRLFSVKTNNCKAKHMILIIDNLLQRQNKVEFLEKQIQRNDEDFTAKYREFSRKIDELDTVNRSYREAIQKLDLKGGAANYSIAVESPIVIPL